MMHGHEKSDLAIVAVKPTNEAGRPAEEPAEPRAGTKGNADQQSTRRTQSRERVSQALDRVRKAARQRKKEKFTALLHHIDVDALRRRSRAEAEGGPRRGWRDVAGLRGGPRAQARGPARAGPPGSVPGATVAPDVHTEGRTEGSGRWRSPHWRTRSSRAQPSWCSTPSMKRTSRLLVRVPTRARASTMRWTRSRSAIDNTEGELDTGRRHPEFFDTVSQEWLVRFVEHRVGDKRIIRLIRSG